MEFTLSTTQGYVFIASFLLAVGLFYAVLFFAFRKKTSYILFTLLCFFHILKILFRPDQDFLLFDTGWQEMFDAYRHLPFMLGGISLVGFLVFEFGVARKYEILGVFVVLLTGCYLAGIPPFGLILFYAIGIAIYALTRDRVGGTYALVGLALFGLFTRLEFMQNLGIAYYIGVIAFMVTMTLLVGQRIKMTVRSQREAMMKSGSLENQLLKSTIQPHFITNSLTSLQELIETDPVQANEFIESLAEEFRLFSMMAEQKLVPIRQELALCRTHLEIMGHRKQGSYILETGSLDDDEEVPPGIFHTLIENGLTHGFRSKKEGTFRLDKHTNGKMVSYHLRNDGEVSPGDEKGTAQSGTGFKYIKNRLIENYNDNWSLQSHTVNGQYEVIITLPK